MWIGNTFIFISCAYLHVHAKEALHSSKIFFVNQCTKGKQYENKIHNGLHTGMMYELHVLYMSVYFCMLTLVSLRLEAMGLDILLFVQTFCKKNVLLIFYSMIGETNYEFI